MTPVLEDGRLVGVITRTDLLHTLVDDTPLMPVHLNNEARTGRHAKRVTGLMRERLPREVIKILRDLGATARDLGLPRLPGGGQRARPVLLRRQNLDLDVVVEGEGILFAQAYAAGRPKVRVRPHKKFNTAVLVFSGRVQDRRGHRPPGVLPVPGRPAGGGAFQPAPGPVPAGLHHQHPGPGVEPGFLRRPDRLLWRAQGPEGEGGAGAAQPLLCGRSHPGAPGGAFRAAAGLPHRALHRGADQERAQDRGLQAPERPAAVQRVFDHLGRGEGGPVHPAPGRPGCADGAAREDPAGPGPPGAAGGGGRDPGLVPSVLHRPAPAQLAALPAGPDRRAERPGVGPGLPAPGPGPPASGPRSATCAKTP